MLLSAAEVIQYTDHAALFRRCTSTSLMVEDHAWHLKETSCSCTGIVATCLSLAKRANLFHEGNLPVPVFSIFADRTINMLPWIKSDRPH